MPELSFDDHRSLEVPCLSVIEETSLVLKEKNSDQDATAYNKSGRVYWKLLGDGTKVIAGANLSEGSQYVSVAFFELDSNLKMKEMTEFKVFEITRNVNIRWYKNYIDMDEEHTVGARIRLMEQFQTPSLTNLTDTDVVFIVGDSKLLAHRAYVSAISPVFKRMFKGDFRESSDKEVKIKDASPDDFCSFLAWLYHYPRTIHDDNVIGLLLLADCYEVKELLRQCLAYVRWNSRIPLVDKFVMAEKYSDKGLSRYLLDSLTIDDARDLLENEKAGQLGSFVTVFLEHFCSSNLSGDFL